MSRMRLGDYAPAIQRPTCARSTFPPLRMTPTRAPRIAVVPSMAAAAIEGTTAVRGARVGVILSGGNVDLAQVGRWMDGA